MKSIRTASLRPSAPRKLAFTLTIVCGLATAGFLAAAPASAANDGQPGADAPHQERNPSQHPELFVLPSLANRGTRPLETEPTLVLPGAKTGARVAYTTLPLAPLPVKDDQPGTGAPHQERNPSQHPELFGAR